MQISQLYYEMEETKKNKNRKKKKKKKGNPKSSCTDFPPLQWML